MSQANYISLYHTIENGAVVQKNDANDPIHIITHIHLHIHTSTTHIYNT